MRSRIQCCSGIDVGHFCSVQLHLNSGSLHMSCVQFPELCPAWKGRVKGCAMAHGVTTHRRGMVVLRNTLYLEVFSRDLNVTLHFGKLQEIIDKPCTSLGCSGGLFICLSEAFVSSLSLRLYFFSPCRKDLWMGLLRLKLWSGHFH